MWETYAVNHNAAICTVSREDTEGIIARNG